ncbi:MAG: acyl-ACP--UDP-N-acetylglucosamine O-acyltransferase [Planctomycetaceae bacterium]
MSIHPLAAVSPDARLGMGVKVGAFASIEEGVELGDHCVVASGAIVKSGVVAGPNNEFCEHSVVGGAPQHIARPTDIGRLLIGSGNVFREHVTIHRGLKPGSDTVVGDTNYVMAGAHFGHDCVIGSGCIFANGAMLGGHVHVDDKAFVSGAVAVHQFCRIGRLAMVGGHARVTQDIPPYMLVDGQSGCIVGLNVVGLRRSGHSAAEVADLKNAYRIIFRRGLCWQDVLDTLAGEFHGGPVVHLREFLGAGKRGFTQERRPPPTTLRLRVADDAAATDAAPSLRSKAG